MLERKGCPPEGMPDKRALAYAPPRPREIIDPPLWYNYHD